MMLATSTRVVVRVFVQVFNVGGGSHGVWKFHRWPVSRTENDTWQTSFEMEPALMRRGGLGFMGLAALLITALPGLG